jgi:limonene-1,2-epoxide hydrolase
MPDSHAPIAIVKSFLNAMARKDYDRGLAMVSDHCEYDNVPIGKVRGKDAIRGVLEPFFAPTLENEFVFRREVADGRTVFIERLDRHHLADRWVELPVTGVFEVNDGLITLWRDYFDAATIISVWPAPPS